jgi:tetratricopeptide (TPR) repeat protein
MNKNQILLLVGGVLLFLILYFGFDIIPQKTKDLEKSRSLNIESTGINNLLKDAMATLDAQQKSIIEAINLDVEKSSKDTTALIERIKSLSGTWYEFGFPSISGSYAEDIANMLKTDESWSIAGTTYAICVKNSEDPKVKDFCSKRAVKAFEKAISISPENIEHRINLAICYVDNPVQDNPMQGILMLRELNTNNPENVAVLNQLGKLAIQTNQNERALERLETAIGLEPENQTTICLLATAYKNMGNAAKADEYSNKCVN